MGQGISKVGREDYLLEIEEEKKVDYEIQKHKDKKEPKRKDSNRSAREKRTREMKLCHADQETTNTTTIPDNTYPSSVYSMKLDSEFCLVNKEKGDTGRNEPVYKFPDSFEGNDNDDCVNVHTNPLNQTLHVASAIVEPALKAIPVQENHEICPKDNQKQRLAKDDGYSVLVEKDMKITDKTKADQKYDLSNACPLPSSDTIVKQVEQDDLELEVRLSNSYYNEKGLTEFVSTTAEKMRKRAKDEKMHADAKAALHTLTINGRLGSVTEDFLYDLDDKCFRDDTLSVDDLNLQHENVLCKFSVDCVDYLSIRAFWYPINRPLYVHAIGFRSEPILLRSSGDQSIIKCILQTPHLREFCLEDEHFRLATFSLSASNYKMGDMLKLSAWGYFFDVDRRVKCFSCKNTYRSGNYDDHHQNCIGRYSDRNVGRSIADYYGELAPGRLVPSGQNVQEEHRFPGSIDIHIHIRRQTTTSFRLGGTQQFAQYDTETQDHEEDDNEEEISVRVGLTSSRTVLPQGENSDVSSSEHCRTDTEWEHTALPSSNPILTQRQEDGIQRRSYYPHEREASSRSASCPDSCTAVLCQDQRLSNYGAEQSNDGWRTIKEDVNRGKPKGSAERYNLLMENERLRSKTQCCICNNRRCNIVFKPCGHLVICDNCITNTTECPVCKKKVDEAYPCG